MGVRPSATILRILTAIMTTDQPVHYGTIHLWVNTLSPVISLEAIRGGLRRLRKKGFVWESSEMGRGYWEFAKHRRNEATKLLSQFADTLEGVSRTPLASLSPMINREYLDIERARLEGRDPFRFRIDSYLTEKIRSICQRPKKGYKDDRAQKLTFTSTHFKLAITHKGAVFIWIYSKEYYKELITLLGKADLGESDRRVFFKKMFQGRPATGAIEIPVLARSEEIPLLKQVKITTKLGDDKIVTIFASSHDAIEMETTGNFEDLQEFLGSLTATSHSNFYSALQVKKLASIEDSLKKGQKETAESFRELAGAFSVQSKAFLKLADLIQQPKEEIPKEDKKRVRPGVR